MDNKISSTHLSRQACVYLRQSTPYQVESNRESTERQYALAERALSLGWDKSQIQILDSDLGKSGKTTSGREDFHKLMAAVSLGEVGAVLALEASRLSRSQADWHKLLDICALTDTLVIDHDGIYNPNDFNDRVLLGFKGTWSHTELHGMRLRLQGAKLNKAKKGQLRCTPPTGYVYDTDGQLVFDPDESVVAAIRLVKEAVSLPGNSLQGGAVKNSCCSRKAISKRSAKLRQGASRFAVREYATLLAKVLLSPKQKCYNSSKLLFSRKCNTHIGGVVTLSPTKSVVVDSSEPCSS